ncbi:hypothetical protein GCM10025331_49290 [Actinoplanes utahensis]|nr:hypothetical protein Aut01nite_56360 [Actinoplanes utahensis]
MRAGPDLVLADKADTSRGHLRSRGIKACIPNKAHRKAEGSKGGRPPTFDKDLYRLRRTVEDGTARLERPPGTTNRPSGSKPC